MIGLMLALAAVAAPAPVEQIDLKPSLPQVISHMRYLLRDPDSMKDVVVCERAVKTKVKDGRMQWATFYLSANAKNGYGGYAGSTGYAAVVYADSRPAWVFATGMPLLAGPNAGCRRVPDTEVRALLGDQ